MEAGNVERRVTARYQIGNHRDAQKQEDLVAIKLKRKGLSRNQIELIKKNVNQENRDQQRKRTHHYGFPEGLKNKELPSCTNRFFNTYFFYPSLCPSRVQF